MKTRTIILLFTGVLLVWALTFLLYIPYPDGGDRGTFGEMFGAINALFTGLAFAGLIITLYIEHREYKEQNTTSKILRFENTLFSLLSIQFNITNNLYYSEKRKNGSYRKGVDTFDFVYNEASMVLEPPHTQGMCDYIEKENKISAYKNAPGIESFDHYFRHLYRIFKYIDESPLINDQDRYNYTCIVRAQLSESELLMLFYNALNVKDDGEYKFKNLIEKYALFNNIRKEKLARIDDAAQYDTSAYIYQELKNK